uniref:ATP-binding protein n=2 Tax=Flavobacterium sp. TaxID=239 RepID=UPI00404B8384
MWNSYFYAQKNTLKTADSLIKLGRDFSAEKKLNEMDTINLSTDKKALRFFLLGKVYEKQFVVDKAISNYLKARNLYLKVNSLERAQQINLDIYYILSSSANLSHKADRYLDEYLSYAKKTNDSLMLAIGYEKVAVSFLEKDPVIAQKYFKKALKNGAYLTNKKFALTLYNNLGVFYNEVLKKHDSALIFYNKNYGLIKNDKLELTGNFINRAGCYYYLKEYRKSLKLLSKADSLSNFIANKESYQSHIKYVNALNYEGLGDFEKAYRNMQAYDSINVESSENEFELKTSEFLVQYEAQEKEIENLKLTTRLQSNRIWLFSIVGAFLILLVSGVFWISNLKKKRQIAIQESLIQKQQLEKELKEQEINSIDMILASQERERKKIADELHDSLGSLMVTLKYNVNYLEQNIHNSDGIDASVITKTNALLDEAYNQVRSISHIKNLGLNPKEGLVKAIQNMISKINVPNRITFKFIPFGLTKRLDNQIEIFVFRIVQEMCTNILKYAQANEVSINLTQHGDDELNIIVEDDGIGFDPKKIQEKKGIGLKNIEFKIENMGGTFEIDSVLGKGTTILLNIPI